RARTGPGVANTTTGDATTGAVRTPPEQYASGINQLELTFLPTPQKLQVVLELDKRGGVFTEGHDAFGSFDVDYASADQIDWVSRLDQWLRQSASRRGLFF
ncbi:sporulation protein, partial [Actinoplanes philippinensis]|uniref:sporulation protein n=1 Tax=Actinoplanes philippinensis TaxID=35752 RepID=UPI00340359EC